eukprot:g10091.t1
MSSGIHEEAGAYDEGSVGVDDSHDCCDISYGVTGVGPERAADASSACASADDGAGASASTRENSGHETDDIFDIVDVGLGGLPTLSASGQLSVLSASAAEFTPGGQGQPKLGHEQDGPHFLPAEAARDGGQDHFGVEGERGEDGVFYAEVQLEAEVLELMAESFSDCSLESLQVALAKSDWDLDRASAAILSALEAVCDPSSAAKTKPCRHLLIGGECRRSDCAFSHDFATTTCRFWLQGDCVNSADGCHFLHDLDVPAPDPEPADTGGARQDRGGDSTVPPTRWAREGETGGGVSEWTPARGSDTYTDLDTAADDFGHGGEDGVGGGQALLTEEFPMLESKKASPAYSATFCKANVCVASEPPGGAHRTDGLASPSVFGAVVPEHRDSPLQLPAGGNTLGGKTGEGEGRGGDEDELLAAVVATTRIGAGGGNNGNGNNCSRRKGGRGRKTKFTPVDLQALLKPATNTTSTAANAQASKPSYSRASESESASTPSNGQPPSHPPRARHPRAWGNQSTTTAGVPLAPARTTESGTGTSFADVVGSSPSSPPAPAGSRGAGGLGGHRSNINAVGVGGKGTRFSDSTSGGRGEWVSTGDAVKEQYEQARMEAGELARARNKLFTSATEAFRRGQGMVARDLARRGRELNVLMKEKHRQAASKIFASRNPGDQVFERRTIDLHGLHVAEAVDVLDSQMLALAGRGVSSVRVLTGTGHHSKGPTNKTRLIPAVECFCRTRGFPLTSIPDRTTGHVGAVDEGYSSSAFTVALLADVSLFAQPVFQWSIWQAVFFNDCFTHA